MKTSPITEEMMVRARPCKMVDCKDSGCSQLHLCLEDCYNAMQRATL